MIQLISSIYESNLSLREFEIQKLLEITETNKSESKLWLCNYLEMKNNDSNTSKIDTDTGRGRKIKVLKSSNIDYANHEDDHKELKKFKQTLIKIKQKSFTSAGFSVENRDKPMFEGLDFKYSDPRQVAKDQLDDEIEISYRNHYDTPSSKQEKQYDTQSNSTERQKEPETIVPPLPLKNIGSSKNTQYTNTGKLTKTTMNTTQIRDKMALNNLKNNVNSGMTNHKSNVDCKVHKLIQF